MSAPTVRLPLEWWAPTPINTPATTTDVNLITRGGRLYGWAFQEMTGTDRAELELVNGQSNNGDTIVPITLSAGQSTRDWLGRPGLRITGGVRLNVISGEVSAVIYYLGLSDAEILALAGYELA